MNGFTYKLWDDINEYDVCTALKVNENDIIELNGHNFFVKRMESENEFYVILIGKIVHARFE